MDLRVEASSWTARRQRDDRARRHGQRDALHGCLGAVDARCCGTAIAAIGFIAAQPNFYQRSEADGEGEMSPGSKEAIVWSQDRQVHIVNASEFAT